IPYGLHRLEEGRRAGYLILVEGESDCWTLWQHGYPALGLPGAAMYTCLKCEYLDGIDRIYVLQEPDKAGSALPGSVGTHLAGLGYTGTVLALDLAASTGAEDPNALHQSSPDASHFKAAFEQARDQAGTPRSSPSTPAQAGDGLPEIQVNNVQLRDMVNAS